MCAMGDSDLGTRCQAASRAKGVSFKSHGASAKRRLARSTVGAVKALYILKTRPRYAAGVMTPIDKRGSARKVARTPCIADIKARIRIDQCMANGFVLPMDKREIKNLI